MSRRILCCAALAVAASSLVAQSSPSSSPSGTNTPAGTNAQARPGRTGAQEPCWQVAGIQKPAMEQVWTIERETHSQVEGVCSNSSLTPQQKREQVHQLREQARQKVEGLITPEQDKALESCRQQHGWEHQGGMRGEGGGCEGQGQRGQGGWQRQGGPQNGGSQSGSQGSGTRPSTQPSTQPSNQSPSQN